MKSNSQQFVLPSPAKLNLFLHIVGRRADGYHNIQTVFQFIDFCDVLTFKLRLDSHIHVAPKIPNVDTQDNLIYKAAKLLQQHTNTMQGVEIGLNKQLPIGAGIGGGSSNAATTLLALNKLWNCHLTIETLHDLACQLGADVPIFVHGHAAWGEGRGDQLTPIILPEPWYVVLIPPCHIETKKIFNDPRLTRDSAALKITSYFPGQGHNDLETVVRMDYPEVAKAIDWLGEYAVARMSGSGSVVFAGFDTREEASRIATLAPTLYQTIVAKGLNHSPLQLALAHC